MRVFRFVSTPISVLFDQNAIQVFGEKLIPYFCGLLDDFGVTESKSWGFFVSKKNANGYSIDRISSSEALRLQRMLINREFPYILCGSPVDANGLQKEFSFADRVSWLRGSCFFDDYFWLKVNLDIYENRVVDFFVELCKKANTPFLRYSPDIFCVNMDSEMALNMVLERSKGFMDAERPEWIWAKDHFSLFPKMQHEGAALLKRKTIFMPERIGWLNWWSAEVCEYIGFPDSEKDARILPLCERMPTGHWFVQLTEDPLDLRRADHLETIAWAYWRFDKIGLRVKPVAGKKAKERGTKVPTASVAGAMARFRIYECDEVGNWWEAAFDPIEADSADQALRIFFAQQSKGRLPKLRESLPQLRKAYDEVAMEVELPMSKNYQARREE